MLQVIQKHSNIDFILSSIIKDNTQHWIKKDNKD